MTTPFTIVHAHTGNIYGGVEAMLVTLARHRGPLDHRFALRYEGRFARDLRDNAAPVAMLGDVRLSRPWTVIRARRSIVEMVRAHRPAVVMCHSVWALAIFGPAARAAGVPLLFWAHEPLAGRHWLERLARVTALPDLAISNSHHTGSAFRQAFPEIPVEVVYPPVAPPPIFEAARRSIKREAHGAPPDTVVVTIAARLARWKGHAVMLQALARLQDHPRWVGWIVGGAQQRGEDIYRAELERQVNETRIAHRIHFLGERSDVAALLWASDIYCQPNTQPEPFGISFIEASYAGLPIITSDLGGAREIVTPECGVLLPPGNPGALRDALARLMTDAALRNRALACGPARAQALCNPAQQVARLSAAVRSLSSHAVRARSS